ncbi:MAG TPA: hypothetical protein VH108_02460 [Gaiellaceae bacterium]|nr:hypothetical protein [Gaiellaceae bacterium]
MRRLCLILLCGLVAVPAALAAASTPGDGVLELSKVNGTAVATGSRGTLWGQMDKGRVVATDPIVGDGQVLVSGWESKKPGLIDGTTVYSGIDLHFRVTGGRYKLLLKGSGIDFTAVGVGTAQLSGDVLSDNPGYFSLDSGKWLSVPFFPATRLVQFGEPTP